MGIRVRNKLKNVRKVFNHKQINKVRQNQNVNIHLGKPPAKRRNVRPPLRTTNAPIIRRYYQPPPTPDNFPFQTAKNFQSIQNTLRELKMEQDNLKTDLVRSFIKKENVYV